MRFPFKTSIVSSVMVLSCFLIGATSVYSQNFTNLDEALMLMHQHRYEEAYNRLQPYLATDSISPGMYAAAVTCLTHLKKYDQAIVLVKRQLNGKYGNIPISAKLGELYHLKGDTAMALVIWKRSLAANKSNLQAYRGIAMTMADNGEFSSAIAILLEARNRFKNHLLFISELTEIYLQAGQNREAVSEFLNILKNNPRELPLTEALLERLGDATLYSAADEEIHDALNHSDRNPAYKTALQELLIWVNLQNNDYKQAYDNAISLQQRNPGDDALFEVGWQLARAGKYELAHKAYQWYIHHPDPMMTPRSMEQLALLDIRQAGIGSTNLLLSSSHIDSLYRNALNRLQVLSKRYPDYAGMNDLLLEMGELSLDYQHDTTTAHKILMQMKSALNADSLIAQYDFLNGRIYLFNGNFDRARVLFTRAFNQSKLDSLRNKARFYLVLNDFYAGDFSYAARQIQSLEQNPGSFYANNALKLKHWLQDGMIRDSVTRQLSLYARARYLYSRGDIHKAFNLLLPDILTPEPMPLNDDMALLCSRLTEENHPAVSLMVIDWYLQHHSGGPLYERLLWQRARLADQLNRNGVDTVSVRPFLSSLPDTVRALYHHAFPPAQRNNRIQKLTGNIGDVITLYEQILIHYPSGFYAPYCRQHIRSMQDKIQS